MLEGYDDCGETVEGHDAFVVRRPEGLEKCGGYCKERKMLYVGIAAHDEEVYWALIGQTRKTTDCEGWFVTTNRGLRKRDIEHERRKTYDDGRCDSERIVNKYDAKIKRVKDQYAHLPTSQY